MSEKKTKKMYEHSSPMSSYKIDDDNILALLSFIEINMNKNKKESLNALSYLLKIISTGCDVDCGALSKLYEGAKDVEVAAGLKRALNKIHMRKMYFKDPTSKYDKELPPEVEEEIIREIDRLRILYDKSFDKKGLFDRNYRLIRKIAEGGMGTIYKGIKLDDNKPIAIKFLLLEELSRHNDRDRMIARFQKEGRILKKLDHPNIIRAYEYGEADGEYFLVLEYADGGSLEDALNNVALDLVTFRRIALQLCDAVAYIHHHGIVHRDIKPGNVLLTKKDNFDQIKLSDFGLSKDKNDRKLSRVSFQAGTDEYSSLQQLRDARDADERDDIFSMGKTFYEMLTNRTFKHGEPYVEIVKIKPSAGERLDAVIMKCLEEKRRNRYQGVSELREALVDAL